MELIDILFVIIGLLCVAASFFLPEKLAGSRQKEEKRAADLKEAVLAELRKKENLDRIVTDALAELSGVPVPKAVEGIRSAKVLHNTVVNAEEMKQAVKEFLG